MEVTGGHIKRYSLVASMTTEPAPQQRPTEAREKEVSGSEALGLSRALGGGGESMALMVTAEEYESNDVFGNGESSGKQLVDNGASEHYLGSREQLSHYALLGAPHEITTAFNKVKGVDTGIISRNIIDQIGVKHLVRLPAVVVPDIGRNLFSV